MTDFLIHLAEGFFIGLAVSFVMFFLYDCLMGMK